MDIENHYRNNYKLMVNIARRSVYGNENFLAEECVQQAYSKFLYFLTIQTEEKDYFEGYFYRILFNVIHTCNEQEMKRGMTGRNENSINFIDTSEETIFEDNVPLSILEHIHVKIVLGSYLKQSLTKHRVLKLFFLQGYTHKEISAMTKISEKTSRNIVCNTLKSMRGL